MKKFLLLYQGPATPPDASHEGWPQWFTRLGDKLVDRGSPMAHGRSLRGDGSAGDSAISLNGYSIIQAEDRDEALGLLHDHPYLSPGNEYTVEIFDLG
ncbi:MAG TPA: YciI family protein [Ktedonobacteraceae bacterium]